MSDQMTSSARTDRHPNFEHVAVYHAGDDDLADKLVPDIGQALEHGHAVLVCSSRPVWQRIATQLGPRSDDVEYVPDEVRYDHPNISMRILHDFARDRARGGAKVVWSIGAVPFNGDDLRNADWVRYEQAVNEVLQHLPLRAVCTYDVTTTPAALLDEARCTHTNRDGTAATVRAVHVSPVLAPITVPAGDPLLRLQVHSSRSARHTVAEAYRELIDDDALADLVLIVSEVVSNALTHGEPPVTLSTWFDSEALSSVVDVTDCGPGIDDPFIDLRPPRQRPGGAGMWIVGQLSERVTTEHVDGVHHVTVSLGHRRPAAD